MAGSAWPGAKNWAPRAGLEATPLVSDGVIYTTGEWSVAFAMDAEERPNSLDLRSQGNRAHARTICCDVVNRGVALYHGKVYLGTLDGRLIALDAKTGRSVGTCSPQINLIPTRLPELPASPKAWF